jgi:hypothetical protein
MTNNNVTANKIAYSDMTIDEQKDYWIKYKENFDRNKTAQLERRKLNNAKMKAVQAEIREKKDIEARAYWEEYYRNNHVRLKATWPNKAFERFQRYLGII